MKIFLIWQDIYLKLINQFGLDMFLFLKEVTMMKI